MKKLEHTRFSWLILFASMGTLLCCALPITLVSLGLGAVMASLVTNVPFLVTLSMHKLWVFIGSAVLLALGGWALYRPGRSCPTDPELARLCERAQVWNRRVHGLSVAIWMTGFFFAFLFLPIQKVFAL